MQAYPKEGGDPIAEGQEVTDFRGKAAFFVAVTREPQGSSEGRIATIRASEAWLADGPPPTFKELMEEYRTHSWDERLSDYGESFPSVYGLVIR